MIVVFESCVVFHVCKRGAGLAGFLFSIGVTSLCVCFYMCAILGEVQPPLYPYACCVVLWVVRRRLELCRHPCRRLSLQFLFFTHVRACTRGHVLCPFFFHPLARLVPSPAGSSSAPLCVTRTHTHVVGNDASGSIVLFSCDEVPIEHDGIT